ncbi:MAG: hypothetical protein K5888_12335 [Lachnospiraceae bacterium]|nr:hypothetical protein [Lachnospiraceae bacterium]
MLKKKENILPTLYVILMLAIMVLPAIFMNNDQDAISLTTNSELMEWSYVTSRSPLWFLKGVDGYVEQRIGFKDEAISAYEKGIDGIFGLLLHPSYAYGEEGHLIASEDEIIRDYQHINVDTDAEFIDSYTEFVKDTYDYLTDRNISFLYFLAPDKQTIYPEYMDHNINVYSECTSRTERILSKLSDVPYIYPVQEFYDKKPERLLFNKTVDVYHWNKYGEYLGNVLIDNYIVDECGLDVVPLRDKAYTLNDKHVDGVRLSGSNIFVSDDIPEIVFEGQELTENAAPVSVNDITEEDPMKEKIWGDFEHYINPNAPNETVFLLLHDSYMANGSMFYADRYKESIAVHIANYAMLKELVETYHPDVVVLENVERVFNCEWFDYETLRTCVK